MRFGKWRGVPLTFALGAILGMGSTLVRADGWRLHYTIPREVPAYDNTTGGPYYAPPVPYGHYAKDYYGDAAKAVGSLNGCFGDLWNKTVGLFHNGGEGCGPGQDCGTGDGSCLGNGSCHGHGCGGLGTAGIASNDCGFCAGRGLFHHGCGGMVGAGSCLDGNGSGVGHGLISGPGHKKHFAPCHASTVAATGQVQPVGQTIVSPTAQSACSAPGCKIAGRHSHLGNLMNKVRCRFCGGGGCGACGGIGTGDPCSSCGGCGLLGGLGKRCGGCGGCGLSNGGTGCGLCGGKGCANCLQGLGTKAHGLLGHLAGATTGLFHRDKLDWFVGPGGPVPLTPGYVPYIVTTRSPRDFFAFPPMNPNDP